MNGDQTVTLTLESKDEALLLFGSRDQFLRLIRDALGVRIIARGDVVHIEGRETQVDQAERVFQQLRVMLKKQGNLTGENVRTVLAIVQQNDDRQGPQNLAVTTSNRNVRPRTDGQARHVVALHANVHDFAIGAVVTGKDYH